MKYTVNCLVGKPKHLNENDVFSLYASRQEQLKFDGLREVTLYIEAETEQEAILEASKILKGKENG